MVRGLRPEDPHEWMRDELAVETRDILLVGHMPHLPGLAYALIGGQGEFPLQGPRAACPWHGGGCPRRRSHR